jgi:hypothetical protein
MLSFVLAHTNKLLAVAALLPAAGVVTYGAFVSISDVPPLPSPEQQDYVTRTYTLRYADGQKAMFKTDYGSSLVFVGSSLGETGRVTEIAKQARGWVVSTTKGYNFRMSY